MGHIVDRCYVEESDVGSMTDERAQWAGAVAIELHKIGMGLVKADPHTHTYISIYYVGVSVFVLKCVCCGWVFAPCISRFSRLQILRTTDV
jgi:hypothetical protein